jgi:hypothetical protein
VKAGCSFVVHGLADKKQFFRDVLALTAISPYGVSFGRRGNHFHAGGRAAKKPSIFARMDS